LAKCYDDTLSDILDKHAPVKRKVMVVRPRVPWFTNNLRRLKAERRKLERKMVKSGLQSDKDAYHKACDNFSAARLILFWIHPPTSHFTTTTVSPLSYRPK
jgi:hypothetical protein